MNHSLADSGGMGVHGGGMPNGGGPPPSSGGGPGGPGPNMGGGSGPLGGNQQMLGGPMGGGQMGGGNGPMGGGGGQLGGGPLGGGGSSSAMISMPLNANHGRCCAGCGGKIVERFLLSALERYWHTSCLKCSCCGAMLADIGSTCFTRANMILCRNDYLRIFGSPGACTACGQSIPAHEFVMRTQGNVYHLKCFACAKCHNQLVPGDRYNVINGNLLCEQDCHKFLKGTIAAAAAATAATGGPVGRKAKMSRQEARQNKMAKAAALGQLNMDLNQGAFI